MAYLVKNIIAVLSLLHFLVKPEIMPWPGAVEVHQLVFELLAGGLGDHGGQGQVVNLQLTNQVELWAFSASEIPLEQKNT